MNSRSFATHDGSFHADEVTACALLLLFDLIDRDKIIRTRDLNLLAQCEYVCDVGGIYDPATKRFDHHQMQYEGDLSSAGMVLLYLKERGIIDEDLYRCFNMAMVMGIDAHDNGQIEEKVGLCTFSNIISNFIPIRYDAKREELDAAFFAAVEFTLGHLSRFRERHDYNLSCREKIKRAMEEGKEVLFFEEAMPWMDNFFALGGKDHPAQFIVMPTQNHWKVRGVPPDLERRMQVRKPLPKEWAGLLEGELKEKSGIPGAIFCHKGRFISVWKTKEDAIKALKIIMGDRS